MGQFCGQKPKDYYRISKSKNERQLQKWLVLNWAFYDDVVHSTKSNIMHTFWGLWGYWAENNETQKENKKRNLLVFIEYSAKGLWVSF